jgi:hypothetical protein
MTFYTLIHVGRNEQSLHNNGFIKSFEEQIRLYLNCAKQLHRSLASEGVALIVLTNDKVFLEKLNDDYKIAIAQLEFSSTVPSGIKFYSAHFKLEVFSYLASLTEDYVALVDSDMLCVNRLPEAFKNVIAQRLPLYYDITDQVTPAYGANAIVQDKELISGKASFGLWAGGEFLSGPPSFFRRLAEEVNEIKDTYYSNAATLHHQGDEMLTSVAIENIKKTGDIPLLDAGALSFVARYWSYVPLHVQKPLEGYCSHFILHLPSDKKFIARLQPDELKGAAFFKKYKRHLSLSRTMETVFKNIKPYAKRLRKKLAF